MGVNGDRFSHEFIILRVEDEYIILILKSKEELVVDVGYRVNEIQRNFEAISMSIEIIDVTMNLLE